AMSLSLHEASARIFPVARLAVPTPDLPLIDPGIVLERGGEADVSEDVKHRLAGSRRRLAVARQRDPVAVPGLGLEDHRQVELDATCDNRSFRVDQMVAFVPWARQPRDQDHGRSRGCPPIQSGDIRATAGGDIYFCDGVNYLIPAGTGPANIPTRASARS